MALVACKDCNAEISTDAKNCSAFVIRAQALCDA